MPVWKWGDGTFLCYVLPPASPHLLLFFLLLLSFFFFNFCLVMPLPPWFLTWISSGLVPLCLQTAHSLELEALRLSLNNMHTAQLELTQANLQKEKETALTELREMLNGRRAQELALLQSRQQCELELMREQLAREKEEVVLRCGQETGTEQMQGVDHHGSPLSWLFWS